MNKKKVVIWLAIIAVMVSVHNTIIPPHIAPHFYSIDNWQYTIDYTLKGDKADDEWTSPA